MMFLSHKIPLEAASFLMNSKALFVGGLLSVSSMYANFLNRIALKLWGKIWTRNKRLIFYSESWLFFSLNF